MKSCIIVLATATFAYSGLKAAPDNTNDAPLIRDAAHLSIRNEVEIAIGKGSMFLKAQQKPDGSWPERADPGMTALPLIALKYLPRGIDRQTTQETMQRGYGYLRKRAKPDGGIYQSSNRQLNTALCLTALLGANEPEDEALLRAARSFLIQTQNAAALAMEGGNDFKENCESANLYAIACAVEALAAFNTVYPVPDTNWQAAVDFISKFQNPRSHSLGPSASEGHLSDGGFVCWPSDGAEGHGGRETLPSDVAISYSRLLGLLHAGVPKDDPRITVSLDLLTKNFTLGEDPVIKHAGPFFYYYCAAKGLASAGLAKLTLPDGRTVNWAAELALKLINAQNSDGSWLNDNSYRMESNAALVTSYSLIALEIVYYQL